MIQIKNVTITHRKDQRVLLSGVSFVLNPGDRAVLIGEEGNGKSTLLKWIADPSLIRDYADAEGERILTGETLGYLPQELPAKDRKKSVYEYFSENPDFPDRTPKELSDIARPFHAGEDFWYLDQTMESLSGGERVRAQMMRLLLSSPTCLLLDEPSNDIDLDTLRWLSDFIKSFPGIVLFVSHDEVLIRETANVIIHIEQVKRKTESRVSVVRSGYDSYMTSREENYEKQLQQAANDRREKKKRDAKYQEIHDKVERDQARVSRQDPHKAALLKKKMHTVKSMEKRFQREDEEMTQRPDREEAIFFTLGKEPIPNGKTVLDETLDELRADDRILARNIHLVLRGPEKVCIIGKNGAGKSTLIKEIWKRMQGRTDIHAEYMPQNYEELLDPVKTPPEYLAVEGSKDELSRIRTFLGALKFTRDEMDHPISELSGGQKAKVFLLKMSLSHPDVLILDEPTRNFSPLSNPVIRQMFRAFPGAILSVSHDRMWMREVADRVLRLTPDGLEEVDMEEEEL